MSDGPDLLVDAELLTKLLRLPEGTTIIDTHFEEPDIVCLKIRGPGLPKEGLVKALYEWVKDTGVGRFVRYEEVEDDGLGPGE